MALPSQIDFNQSLLAFLDNSPTPFHAVAAMVKVLRRERFTRLDEAKAWGVLEPGRYYVTRNDSSLIAFHLPKRDIVENGFHMVGTHTDSPCLKVKPQPEKVQHSLMQLGVEVYGGALLNPWFDRDLSMAGRVSYRASRSRIRNILIDFKKAVASIPSLAIHLDRDANKNRTVNAQQHLLPIIMQIADGDKVDFREFLKHYIKQHHPMLDIEKVLDHEINLYDTQKAAFVGLNNDFISSARLDNLLSCYIGLSALLNTELSRPSLLVCSDHEEVGSVSAAGAQGSFLQSILLRLAAGTERYQLMLQRSMMISVDNAHAVHPNYPDKYDLEHTTKLNAGPVIKSNAEQRYATNSASSAYFRDLCERNKVPVQDFVMRADMRCGSTIGPMTSAALGIKTVDVGIATLAMHSIRELAGSDDPYRLHAVLTSYFKRY